MDCIFCKIINKEIPAKMYYEDEDVAVFPDVHPVKPVHILVIPKAHIEDFSKVEDTSLYAKLFGVVEKMIEREGLKDKGYKIVVNGGGVQDIVHLHVHLMGPMKKGAILVE